MCIELKISSWKLPVDLLGANALAIKIQNIGASTKKFCKQMFNFDTLVSNEWKYRSLGSFETHAYASNTLDGWVVVHQN